MGLGLKDNLDEGLGLVDNLDEGLGLKDNLDSLDPRDDLSFSEKLLTSPAADIIQEASDAGKEVKDYFTYDEKNPHTGLSALNNFLTLPGTDVITDTAEFGKNIKISFERGAISTELNQASYLSTIGKLDFETEVRPLFEQQEKIRGADPVKGKNKISDALYQVSGMLPPIISGIAEGKISGVIAGTGGAAFGPQAALAMYGVGQAVGSFSYWQRLMTGSSYAAMKMRKKKVPEQTIDGVKISGGEEYDPIPDEIAIPASNIIGIVNGGLEFLKVSDLIPGSKKLLSNVIKPLVRDSVRKSVVKISAIYGGTWLWEVGTEGGQAIVDQVGEDVAAIMADKIEKPFLDVVLDGIKAGGKEMKDVWLPMAFMMAPATAVGVPSELTGIEKEKQRVRGKVLKNLIAVKDINQEMEWDNWKKGIINVVDKQGNNVQIDLGGSLATESLLEQYDYEREGDVDLLERKPFEGEFPQKMTMVGGETIPVNIDKIKQGQPPKSEAKLVEQGRWQSIVRKSGVEADESIRGNYAKEEWIKGTKRMKKGGVPFNKFFQELKSQYGGAIPAETSDEFFRLLIDQKPWSKEHFVKTDEQLEVDWKKNQEEVPEAEEDLKEAKDKVKEEEWDDEEQLEEEIESISEEEGIDGEVEGVEEEVKEKPTEKQPFKFQDENQEKVIHSGDWKHNALRHDLEGAGDIFRELAKEGQDEGYISEKIRRLERLFEGYDKKTLHEDDTIEGAWEYAKDNMTALLDSWEKQPVNTPEQQIAKDLNLALLNRDITKAKELVEQIKAFEQDKDFQLKIVKKPTLESDLDILKPKEEGIDLKQLGDDLRDAMPGLGGLTTGDVGDTFGVEKRRQEARKRLVEEHIPELIKAAKKLGMTVKEYLEEFTSHSQDQKNFILNIMQEPSEPKGGKKKVHGLSKSVLDQAFDEEIATELKEEDLGTYQVRDSEKAATRAREFLADNPELGKKIALGEAAEQGDVRSQELFKVIRKKAVDKRDVDTIAELALSKTAAAIATELGQRTQALDVRDTFDPIKTIRKIIKEREEVAGNKPDAKKEQEIAILRQKLEDTEKKLDAMQKKLDSAKTARKQSGKKAFGANNKIFTQSKMEAAREALKKKLSGLHSGVDPTAVIELTTMGGFYFEGGMREFGEWSKTLVAEFGEITRPHLRDIWDKVKKDYHTQTTQEIKERMSERSTEEGVTPEDLRYNIEQLAESLIESGTVTRHGLVKEMHEVLQQYFPDLTYYQTEDLVSGYGKYKRLNDNAIKAILRRIKGELQQVGKLRDMLAGLPSKKTGVERRKLEDEERRLTKLVNEYKRRYKIKTTDPQSQLRSALDSYKTRLRNSIKDLEKQIAERKKIIKNKTSLRLDAEAMQLMERKTELRNAFNAIFGKEGLSTEQRIKMAQRSLERSIATYEEKIRKGDISPITKKRKPVSTPQIEKLRLKREILSKELKRLRDLAKPKKTSQEIGLQTLKTRLTNETKRLEDRLARMDFEVKAKREIVLDAEVKKLKSKRDRVKDSYKAAQYVKENLTKAELSEIVRLSADASEAKDKIMKSDDWTADNAQQVEDYFYKKNAFDEYVKSLKPKVAKDRINNIIDYFRASILASPRILRNSFLYQIIPAIERTITKRLVTGAFSDADLKSNIVEKLQAKLSGIKPSTKSADFVKRQVAMATRIYHKTGIDISRQDKMESVSKIYGEKVGKITGTSVFAKIGKTVNLAPKWLAGGTDMLFANIGRADTAIMMSKEIANIEKKRGMLPEGMTEEQRADQLLKESYSFDPKDKRAAIIREASILDAHMMNNTQPGWWSDMIIDFRRTLKLKDVHFGKVLIPFAKIANVVVAEGFKTASGAGIVKSLWDINQANRKDNIKDRARLMQSAVSNLVRYVGLLGATFLLTAFLDDDDYVGTYATLGRKDYQLARARGARTGSIRIAGKWISLRYLPMLNIPISAVMEARQAKREGHDPAIGYLRGVIGQILEAPGVKDLGERYIGLKRSVKTKETEKFLDKLGLDGEGISNWAKVRMIPSVLSYDIWNALFPKDSKYDFMGREIEKGVFKDDKSNEITLEFNRLAEKGQSPAFLDPTGKYAVLQEERLGEEAYQKHLNELKRNYAAEVSTFINDTYNYKHLSDEDKKKSINKIRKRTILKVIENEERDEE